jgi:hypothetical protein
VLAGHVVDASGAPVVGARIELRGAISATARTSFRGTYAFRVPPGSYSVTPSDACVLAPSTISLRSVARDTVADFAATGGDCFTSTQSHVIATGSMLSVHRGQDLVAITFAHFARCSTEAAALNRLQQIKDGMLIASRTVSLRGYPAVLGQGAGPMPGPSMAPGGPEYPARNPGPPAYLVTTVIAIDKTVVSLGSHIRGDADSVTREHILGAAQDLSFEDMEALHGRLLPPPPLPPGACDS